MFRFPFLLTLLGFMLILPTSCSNNDEPEDALPVEITRFMEFYFAGREYHDTKTSDGYIVEIPDSVTITFNSDNQWIDINGNGGTLNGDFLLYNLLPEKLYNYLLETEQTDQVYQVKRHINLYTVYLLDSSVTYNTQTDAFQPTAPNDSV